MPNLEFVHVGEYVCLPKLNTTDYNAFDCNNFYSTLLLGGLSDSYNYLTITQTTVGSS
jgi:hypothetical protein